MEDDMYYCALIERYVHFGKPGYRKGLDWLIFNQMNSKYMREKIMKYESQWDY